MRYHVAGDLAQRYSISVPKALGLPFSSPPAPKGHVNSYICSDLTISTVMWLVVTSLSLFKL